MRGHWGFVYQGLEELFCFRVIPDFFDCRFRAVIPEGNVALYAEEEVWAGWF